MKLYKIIIDLYLYLANKKVNSPIYRRIFKSLPIDKQVNVIDVGAFKGDFIDMIKKHRQIKTALIVEPMVELCELLKKKYNKFNYEILMTAITDYKGKVEFNKNKFLETSSILEFKDINKVSSIDTECDSKIEVECTTTDDLVKEKKDLIDVIKIDVQGAEIYVLKGATETLKQCRFLIIEVSFKSVYEHSALFAETHEFLAGMGMKLVEIEPVFRADSGEILQADVLYMQ